MLLKVKSGLIFPTGMQGKVLMYVSFDELGFRSPLLVEFKPLGSSINLRELSVVSPTVCFTLKLYNGVFQACGDYVPAAGCITALADARFTEVVKDMFDVGNEPIGALPILWQIQVA